MTSDSGRRSITGFSNPTVKALRALGVEFVETEAAHTEQRGAISKTYLGSVVFELVHSQRSGA